MLSGLAEYDDVVRGPPFQTCLGPSNPKSGPSPGFRSRGQNRKGGNVF